MKKTLILLIIILVSCSDKKRKINLNNVVNLTDTTLNKLPKNETISNKDSQLYLIKNDTIMQSLEIKNLTDKDINFIIISENKKVKDIKQLEGIALKSNNSDIEFEEDEEGNALPVVEYVYKKNDCWISIRIDLDKKKFIKLKESDCSMFNKNHDLNTGLFLNLTIKN